MAGVFGFVAAKTASGLPFHMSGMGQKKYLPVVISVNYDPGLNLIKRIFHKPDKEALQQLRDQILETVKSETAIRILPTPRTP